MPTEIHVVVDEHVLRRLVLDHLTQLISGPLAEEDVHIEVMTTQNYRVKEWEDGRFRATVQKTVP